jgi:hypothetical protein
MVESSGALWDGANFLHESGRDVPSPVPKLMETGSISKERSE